MPLSVLFGISAAFGLTVWEQWRGIIFGLR
jgi:hypothetical protein